MFPALSSHACIFITFLDLLARINEKIWRKCHDMNIFKKALNNILEKFAYVQKATHLAVVMKNNT